MKTIICIGLACIALAFTLGVLFGVYHQGGEDAGLGIAANCDQQGHFTVGRTTYQCSPARERPTAIRPAML